MLNNKKNTNNNKKQHYMIYLYFGDYDSDPFDLNKQEAHVQQDVPGTARST